jgi:hypothetical protein
MREYYRANYRDYFLGFAIHHYENSVSAWHTMASVQWPSGTYSAGDSVSVTVTLHASDYYYWRPYGVKLEVKDSVGNIWVTSRIVCIHYSSNTRQVTLTWTIPSEAAEGDELAVRRKRRRRFLELSLQKRFRLPSRNDGPCPDIPSGFGIALYKR